MPEVNNFQPGDRFNGYFEIRGFRGKGGIAFVYEAINRKLDERVALKFLDPRYNDSDEIVRKFRLEAQLGRRLGGGQNNLATVHSHDQTDGVHWTEMQWIPGPTLLELISDHTTPWPAGNLKAVRYLVICIYLCRALQVVHENKFVHRDVSPDNAMLHTGQGLVYLTDLGCAKDLNSNTESRLQEIGKQRYMSPEQRRDPSSVDARADLYSLGVTLFEMICGDTDIRCDPESRVLGSLGSEVGNLTYDLIRSLTAPDREERPESASKVASLISSILAHTHCDSPFDASNLLVLSPSWSERSTAPTVIALRD